MKFPTNLSFQRLNSFPLDESSVFDTYEHLNNYVDNDSRSYCGQVVFVKENNSVYFISTSNEIIRLLASNEQAGSLIDEETIRNAMFRVFGDD